MIILQFVDCAIGHFWWVERLPPEMAYITNYMNKVCSRQSLSSLLGHCWPMLLQETLSHSKTVLTLSLCIPWVEVHKIFYWALSVWLVSIDFKWKFTPSTVLLGLFLCHGHVFLFFIITFFLFLVGPTILLSMVIQQKAAILDLSQEKMNSHPSTLPSSLIHGHKPSKGKMPTSHLWTFFTFALSDRLEAHGQSQGHLLSSRMSVFSQWGILPYQVVCLTWWYYLWCEKRECVFW